MSTRRLAILSIVIVGCGTAVWAMWRQVEISNGEKAFAKYGCASCHANGGGPSLNGATQRHETKFLVRFIENPMEVYEERNYRPLNEGWMQMPGLRVTREEAKSIVRFLDSQ